MHLAAVQSLKLYAPPPNLSLTLNCDRLVSEIVRSSFAHVENSAELGSKERKGRLQVTNGEMAAVDGCRGGERLRFQALDCNQVLNFGGWGGGHFFSLFY